MGWNSPNDWLENAYRGAWGIAAGTTIKNLVDILRYAVLVFVKVKRSDFLALASSATVFPVPRTRSSALAAYMAPHVTMAEFRGIVAIAPRGRLQTIAPFGGNFDRTSRFRVASVAKTFTAATVDALIKAGALSLETRLGSLLVPFAGSPITIDHLLNHSLRRPRYLLVARICRPSSESDFKSRIYRTTCEAETAVCARNKGRVLEFGILVACIRHRSGGR